MGSAWSSGSVRSQASLRKEASYAQKEPATVNYKRYFKREWDTTDNDGNNKLRDYRKLRALDLQRKRLLHTQACDGTWHMLGQVSGSVLYDVICSMDMLASVVIYAGTRTLLYLDFLGPIELGDFRGLSTMGVLLSFMITFYTNTCINRMFQTNRDAMRLIARINNIAVGLRGMLSKTEEQAELTQRCLDYLCAAQAWAYIGVSPQTYDPENLWRGFNAEFGVLTPYEEELLDLHKWRGGSRYRECLAWVMMQFDKAVAGGFIAPPIASALHKSLADFQDACQALFDFRYMPIPFVSEHLLVLFMHIYLPIQTFEMALQTEVLQAETVDSGANGQVGRTVVEKVVIESFGLLLAFLANFAFQGLFHVGASLEEPYNGTLSAARVSDFCKIAVVESRRILVAASPGEPGMTPKEKHEEEIIQCWETLEASEIDINKLSPALGLRALRDMVANTRNRNTRYDSGVPRSPTKSLRTIFQVPSLDSFDQKGPTIDVDEAIQDSARSRQTSSQKSNATTDAVSTSKGCSQANNVVACSTSNGTTSCYGGSHAKPLDPLTMMQVAAELADSRELLF